MIYKSSSDYSKFYGRWYDGKLYEGTLIYKNGDSFKGLFRKGRKYYGQMTFANGGDLLDSNETRTQCFARLISSLEKVRSDLVWKAFKGVWHNEMNSTGTLLYEGGSRYVGKLQSNKRHGLGVYTYPTKEEWDQEKANNPKMIIDESEFKRISFSGVWEDNAMVRGIITYRDGDREKYEGQLFDDMPHGEGILTFADRSVYKGHYQNGLKSGSGIYQYPNGTKYDGSWYKDKKHGIGQYTWANGEIYSGTWAND